LFAREDWTIIVYAIKIAIYKPPAEIWRRSEGRKRAANCNLPSQPGVSIKAGEAIDVACPEDLMLAHALKPPGTRASDIHDTVVTKCER
jgi:hypothetical protein